MKATMINFSSTVEGGLIKEPHMHLVKFPVYLLVEVLNITFLF